tara:strand:+ start:2934 stop:3239 length:306 start_codon:yes stop_codon:yes gene_type:complete
MEVFMSEVKISFRTSLKDLPGDIRLLISDIGNSLQIEANNSKHASDSLGHGQCSRTLSSLENTRKDMRKIELRIEDCISILRQYEKYMTPEEPEADPNEER